MPHGQRAYQWLSDANVFVSIDPVSLFGQCGRGQGCGHLHFHSSSPTLTVRSILIQLIVGKLTIFEGFMVAGRNSAHPETLASLPPALLSAYHPSKWMYFWRSCSDTPCTHMSPLSTRPDLPKKAMCSTHHVLVATFPSLSRDGQFWGTRNYGPQVSYHTSPWSSVTISHGFRDSCSVRFATAPFCHNLGTAYPGRDCISGCNAFSYPSPCVPSF